MKTTILKAAFFQENCTEAHFIKMFGEKKGAKHYMEFDDKHYRNLLTFWEEELSEAEQEVLEDYLEKLSMEETLKKKPR